MKMDYITEEAKSRRYYWIGEIVKLSGNFVNDSSRVEQEIIDEVRVSGSSALMDHLRLCTAIPESYVHDSSEEKLYSKYTDALISECFKFIGLNSIVLTERADAADVEASSKNFSFVADAKVFRLSRTAKNQKDFKVQAMDGWRHSNDFAMVVCPIYQLPTKNSQIYQQAISRNVCIFTYTHLGVLVRYSEVRGKQKTIDLLHDIFKSVSFLNPSKDSVQYWTMINRTILEFDNDIKNLWLDEKKATDEGIFVSKEIALKFLSNERKRILNMTKEEAVSELIKMNKITSREEQIRKVNNNNILLLS
ncbi:HindIII family type II restriction endonuclease [Xenorhabdus sp. XENO-7]|uniref:HindIII family type II restriction endonuclease n=1 Tax=Xenorhabdus aichiensis TaxID=3025874 RepID=A0ABT5M827_9GAMM|nr:HindIII family type II restriction endonuclease [Xenorhabdus aichiensis]MDC9623851.1 HindIII family type II restriction endonuclease [Xenorhabdus aichiensis]